MKDFIVYYLGPVAAVCLALMIGFAVYAIATIQIGFMIPAMILGVVALFSIRGEFPRSW